MDWLKFLLPNEALLFCAIYVHVPQSFSFSAGAPQSGDGTDPKMAVCFLPSGGWPEPSVLPVLLHTV